MMLFREQRGGYEESMTTIYEFHSRQELLHHIQQRFSLPRVYVDNLQITAYGVVDCRDGWELHTVSVPNLGVIGFTNGPVPE